MSYDPDLADKIAKGVEELRVAVDKLPTHQNWIEAMGKSLAIVIAVGVAIVFAAVLLS